MAAGVPPILAALGMLPVPLTRGTPAWVGVCAGLLFILGGAAIINGYAIAGGAGPDGDLPPGTSLGVRLAQYHGIGNEWMGRAVFGLGAILVATVTVVLS